jgi:RNA 2',3'-cyclic 3'-phosphodiesterase
VRLFIALELPAEVRAGIDRWGSEELRDPALRRLPEDSLHVTLVFLGDTAVERIQRIAAVLLRLDGIAPRLELAAKPAALPRGRRPGLFALEVRSERVGEIEAELVTALAEAGLHRLEERSFFPHVTVARVRRGKGRSRKPLRVEEPPGRLPERLLRPFLAVRVALYLSSFGPGGVHYSPLAQVELPSGEAAVR